MDFSKFLKILFLECFNAQNTTSYGLLLSLFCASVYTISALRLA